MSKWGFITLVLLVFGTTAGCSDPDGATSGTSSAPEPALETDNEPVKAVSVIPLPAQMTLGAGHLLTGDEAVTPVVTIDEDDTELGEEGYRLDVDSDGIRIVAATEAGAFYANMTLDQLVENPDDESATRVPFVSIEDFPRFEWRGYMLDVSRHFFDVDVIKRQIDVLSSYKLNVLHLHLTDDQGWRIEIDSWPDLTSVGAAIDFDGNGPGGFFTKDDFADIVEYATERFVTVVPEIDLPGHVNAALASYPELNADGTATELTGQVAYGLSALSLSAPSTEAFINDVISEVAEMTPGPYIHIGGDEAISLAEDEYNSLVTMAALAVAGNGKIPVGWEETVTAELPQPSITQYWLDPKKARQALDNGSPLVMSPSGRAYLDMKYDDTTPVGLNWAGLIEVDTAYNWDPTDEGLTDDQILGVEAPLWTETIDSEADLQLMTYPRILGYAEIAWSPRELRNWDDYRVRLAAHGQRLAESGIGYFESTTVDWPTADLVG